MEMKLPAILPRLRGGAITLKSWSKKQGSAHCIRKAVNLLPLG